MRIDTRLSEKIKKLNPSPTLALTSKAKKLKSEGYDIVNLAAGEPDFDTPDFVKEAAISAIKNGFTKYTPTAGTIELRQAICEKLKRENRVNYEPQQIVVSSGAKHAIFNTLLVLLDKNEEVLIPSPYWVSYPEMVRICEGIPVFIKTASENNFKISIKDLEKHVNPKTKAIIINSPSNPSGCVYTEDELRNIAAFCVKKKIFVISDEIYEKIIYDGLSHYSIASFNKDIYNLAVTINGLSKSHSMTGWRVGYLAAPMDIAQAVSKIQDHSTSNTSSISQKAALAALNAPGEFSNNLCQEFQKRRDYIVSRLNDIKKIKYVMPKGAFYIFCNISETGLDSDLFAERLLNEMHVCLIPGSGFGMTDYVRISFANNTEQLAKGLDRLDDWLKKL